jgi:hypothetical protein
MVPRTEKVIDPESVRWIEQARDRQDDEDYFASEWRRALQEARAEITPSTGVPSTPELGR